MNSEKENWYLWDCGDCDPYRNMEIDAVLLENANACGKPLLRLYGWSTPAATFGFFQKEEDVAKLTALRPLVRRPTGGGLVPHLNDFTYSIVFPNTHYWYRLRAMESYRRVHTLLMKAFEFLGVKTELAPQTFRPTRGQCFVGHEQFDLLFNGAKIAGAAQRRTKTGLLIQGSVQPRPSGITHAQWKDALQKSALALFNVAFEEFNPHQYKFLGDLG